MTGRRVGKAGDRVNTRSMDAHHLIGMRNMVGTAQGRAFAHPTACSTRIEIGRDIACLGCGNSGSGHGRTRRKSLRRYDPFDHVVRRVGHDASHVNAPPDILQRPSDLPVATREARNGMASGATIAANEIRRAGYVAARHGNGNFVSPALTLPKRSGSDGKRGEDCHGCRQGPSGSSERELHLHALAPARIVGSRSLSGRLPRRHRPFQRAPT